MAIWCARVIHKGRCKEQVHLLAIADGKGVVLEGQDEVLELRRGAPELEV
eukprot:CAMPEP_0179207510 /NCGR_PEP_ID=MMETSP0796-20121207/103477_1 /TAXON_ID=73915 /ORGANISM="Pyrodinium bahamense, Strain pbaha01" /LENGTH=49 /DNA_ID= /DNA_START= /DNA_END= /DNA_ORIENTATION=